MLFFVQLCSSWQDLSTDIVRRAVLLRRLRWLSLLFGSKVGFSPILDSLYGEFWRIDTNMSVVTGFYPHMPILRTHAARYSTNGVKSRTGIFIVLHALADSTDFRLLGDKILQKNGKFPALAPMNRRAKFDAASFITPGIICNRTNTHKQTNKQTEIDISTPCLSKCVDKITYSDNT